MACLNVVEKGNIHAPSWNKIPVVQTTASHFTEYTKQASNIITSLFKLTLWFSVT
jgi:hypothetical protein